MKQRLIEGCDVRSFFSNTGGKMEKEAEKNLRPTKKIRRKHANSIN
jgi:hypothetical protein